MAADPEKTLAGLLGLTRMLAGQCSYHNALEDAVFVLQLLCLDVTNHHQWSCKIEHRAAAVLHEALCIRNAAHPNEPKLGDQVGRRGAYRSAGHAPFVRGGQTHHGFGLSSVGLMTSL